MQSYSRGPFVLMVAAVISGCGDDSRRLPAAPVPEADTRAALTTAVSAELDEQGLFRLGGPTAPPQPVIDESRARALALAFARTHVRGMQATLERDHGASIDVASLAPCGRVFYAETPFEPLPAEVPSFYHRMYGPWWLVTLCGRGRTAQVSVAVSGYADELQVIEGRLAYPSVSGGEFRVLGIPRARHDALPLSPERAVQLAAQLTKHRVAAVPELVAPGPAFYPQTARWHLKLEAPAAIRVRRGTQLVTREAGDVFAGVVRFVLAAQPSLAAETQPEAVEVKWRPYATPGMKREEVLARPTNITLVRRRRDMPVAFEAAIPDGGGA
jgi:hypothetical protein